MRAGPYTDHLLSSSATLTTVFFFDLPFIFLMPSRWSVPLLLILLVSIPWLLVRFGFQVVIRYYSFILHTHPSPDSVLDSSAVSFILSSIMQTTYDFFAHRKAAFPSSMPRSLPIFRVLSALF